MNIQVPITSEKFQLEIQIYKLLASIQKAFKAVKLGEVTKEVSADIKEKRIKVWFLEPCNITKPRITRKGNETEKESGRKSRECRVLEIKKKKKAYKREGSEHLCQILLLDQWSKAWEWTIGFNKVKIIGDLDKKVLVEMLGKSLIGVDIKVNGGVLC